MLKSSSYETILDEFGKDSLDTMSSEIHEINPRDAAAQENIALEQGLGVHEGLLREVVNRRIVPLNRERLRLLDDATKRFGKKAVPVETALHALLAPAIKLYFERPQKASGESGSDCSGHR